MMFFNVVLCMSLVGEKQVWLGGFERRWKVVGWMMN
jgi:hypothetical protein